MSGFAALLKLSQSQTAQSELEVQTQIASHQLQLEKKRREQEVKERKEREQEAKLRAKRFEEQRKEEERNRKRAEAESVRERELAKREEQMRHALKYGPQKSSGAGSSKGRRGDNGGESAGGPVLTREELRKRQSEASEFSSLTREEKRERKLNAELRRTASSSSRRAGGGLHRTTSLPNGRMVRRLPGGAVDYTTVSPLADPDAAPALPSGDLAGKSARERLAAMPSTLMKLNTVKRDVRTIDEILIDRAKAKQATVLAGDDAKDFSDWFGKSKKKEKATSQSSTQQQPASLASSPALTVTPSGSPAPTVNPFANAATPKTKIATLSTPPKPSSPFLKPINPKPSTAPRPPVATSSLPSSKKRPRSPSDSDIAMPSVKRRPSSTTRPTVASSRPAALSRPSASSRQSALSSGVDLSTEIWSIFGKDKKSYVARDVLSDDEDMEADAQSVLKEEARRYVILLCCKPLTFFSYVLPLQCPSRS